MKTDENDVMEDEEMGESEARTEESTEDNQGLECDFSAYTLFHEGSTGAPCLSFDILRDNLGDNRNCNTPVSCYFVAGTEAARTHVNNIILMKMSNLVKIKHNDSDDDSELEDDEDEGTRDEPVIASAIIGHGGCVNRIRSTIVNNVPLAASWSELGNVHIWDLSRMVDAVNDRQANIAFKQNSAYESPLFTFKGHPSEGFAVDWAPSMPGTLATGDCEKNIHVWKPSGGGSWAVGTTPFVAHTASVEDIQWSPNEPHVFASCSVDKSIRVWDTRAKQDKACMLTVPDAHESDVNVIHWNRNEPFIVSGGDDGKVQVWDLRQLQNGNAVAVLKHHESSITTVEWHPTDASVLASGGEDNQILQWDLAVERDTDVQDDDEADVPQHLLFVHKGQDEVKELHWHPQVPGLIVSTALSGFNIFKTIST
ncbi:glutamate-rich WD repeat-containing protein 1-like [Homarus americanus]|uniref:Glutamate-rich WD repeat-containing protein 1-like n=1 Tax=Homarus americanus TaxID=6706 RepID=A0A8J5MRG3_HOMAM|nr:glutamate-rich WD repeat-containing protein 1-like [Homarus americanus]XP_042235822.1 glutamate-rich WD repeat-containing protein 1-like [Homarus americanus]KAG7161258.1 Glutamate-rich WD repeat-containing protein 1-like [Homarus americanus]